MAVVPARIVKNTGGRAAPPGPSASVGAAARAGRGAAGAPSGFANAVARILRQERQGVEAEARKVEAEGRARAGAILEEAMGEASRIRERAEAEGLCAARHSVAAEFLRLAAARARLQEEQLGACVELAKEMAGRLLGEALALEPGRVVALAKQALAQARGARRVTFVAHPLDAAPLMEAIASLGLPPDAVAVEPDGRRARGCLLLRTDAGVLDADLSLQLKRLADALRDTSP